MTASTDPFERIFELVTQRTGLSFPAARRESASQGIQRALERAGASGPHSYLRLLHSQARAFDDLLDELTVGETYFFREPEQLDFLRRHILPEICSRCGPNHVLRIWSAGCASGEEAYSLAILLDQEGLGKRSLILATDLSPAALDRGRRACYRDWSLRGPAADLARPYLQRKGDLFEVAPSLRRRVRFLHLNLVEDTYPSTGICDMDVILCRNVLIYLQPSAIAQVVVRLFESLAPGGWLLPGPSDPLLGPLAPLEIVTTEHGLVYRRPLASVTSDPSPTLPGRGQEEGLVPLSPWGRGVRGEGVGLLQGQSPSPPTPLPQGERGGREEPLSPWGRGEEEEDLLERARQAAAAGAYDLAIRLAEQLPASLAACLLCVRAMANIDTAAAVQACARALQEHTLAVELHHLHSVLLLELSRLDEAEQAARRALYLNPELPLAHFTLGSILWRRGDLSGARRCYLQARQLASLLPADQRLLLEEESAGSFVAAVDAQLHLLDTLGEAGP